MPWRRRRIVEVEEGAPPPLPRAAFGLAALWLYLGDRNDQGTTTVSVETTVGARPKVGARVTVPAVVGLAQADAGDKIEIAGLHADTFPVDSDEARGTVVSQEPAAGGEVDAPSIVRLDVSVGSGPRAARTVPDVTGPAESDARRKAWAEGFTVRAEYRDAPSQEEVGEVLTQEPAAGSTEAELTQITIFVGR